MPNINKHAITYLAITITAYDTKVLRLAAMKYFSNNLSFQLQLWVQRATLIKSNENYNGSLLQLLPATFCRSWRMLVSGQVVRARKQSVTQNFTDCLIQTRKLLRTDC